jgi:predicted RNA-binding protein with PUA-like domain
MPADTPAARRYWLFKSEPESFSIDALMAAPDRTTLWDGVRNYQVRNFMRDLMWPGDGVLFYHSSTEPVGVVGLAEVVSAARPDPTAFDPQHAGYDPKSRPEDPAWLAVEVRGVERFPGVVAPAALRSDAGSATLQALRRGNRLSITPVTEAEWTAVCALGRRSRG